MRFSPLSRALQLRMAKISFSSQIFDFYKNSQKCLISFTVLWEHVLGVPKHFASHLQSYNWLWSILRQNRFFEFLRFFSPENGCFCIVFGEKITIWGPKNFFSKNQDVISKIGLLEAFTICFGITHLKGEVLSPRFEEQVNFWNLSVFRHFWLILADFVLYVSLKSKKGVKN